MNGEERQDASSCPKERRRLANRTVWGLGLSIILIGVAASDFVPTTWASRSEPGAAHAASAAPPDAGPTTAAADPATGDAKSPAATGPSNDNSAAAGPGGTVYLGAYIGTPGTSELNSDGTNRVRGFLKSGMGNIAILNGYFGENPPTGVGWNYIKGNAVYSANNYFQTGWSLQAIVLMGFQLIATTDSSPTQGLRDVANGVHDDVWTTMLNACSAVARRQPGNVFYIRPGVEYNGNWEPVYRGVVHNPQDFIKAFRHVATMAHNFTGSKVMVVWNPGAAQPLLGSAPNYTYPGDDVVDVIGIDTYGSGSGGSPDTDPLNTSAGWWSVSNAAAFAVAHNKPLGFSEIGAGSKQTDFQANVQKALANYPTARIDHFSVWTADVGGNESLYWPGRPAQAAWISLWNSIKNRSR